MSQESQNSQQPFDSTLNETIKLIVATDEATARTVLEARLGM